VATVCIAHDITGRKRAEVLLAAEKQVLEMVAAGAPLPEVLDALTRNVEAQSEGVLCSVLLLDRDGAHLRDGSGPSLPESYRQAVDGIAVGPSAGSCGTAAYRREAVIVTDVATNPLWADYRDLALSHGLRACWSTPILSSGGAVLGTFAMYYRQPRAPDQRDLELIERATHIAGIAMERRRAQEALRERDESLRDLFENANDLIQVVSPDGRLLYVNRAWRQTLGYSEEEVPRLSLSDIVHPDSRGHCMESFQRLVSGESLDGIRAVFLTGDGRPISVEGNCSCRFDDGRPVYVRGIVRDVTTREAAEEALRASEERLRSVFDTARDPIYITSADGTITSLNPAFETVTGWPREEWLGKNFAPLIHPDDLPLAGGMLERLLRGEKPPVFELRVLSKTAEHPPQSGGGRPHHLRTGDHR
jgi:PAS domain S-box-containing protein